MKAEYLATIERQSTWLRWSQQGSGARLWREFMGHDIDGPEGPRGTVLTARSGLRTAPGLVVRRMEAVPIRSKRIVTHDRPHDDGRYVTDIERAAFEEPLRFGDCFYVGPEFCRLVDHARRSLPDATFDPRLLPSKFGFVYFETPLELPRLQGHREMVESTGLPDDYRQTVQAFGWRPVFGKRPGEPAETVRPMTQFTIYQSGVTTAGSGQPHTLGSLARDGYWPLAFFAMQENEVLSVRMREFEGFAEDHDAPSAYSLLADEIWRHEIRLVYTLLLLANQRVAQIKRAPLDRAARRRQAIARPEAPADHIKVITLRRYEERAKNPDEPHEVDWQWQWDVRSHWRWQWYPSLMYHQAIWIDGYTKGPPDKPFKSDQRRVFAVVR